MPNDLQDIDLFEVSLCKTPANPGAKVALFKEADEDSDLLSQLFERFDISKSDDITVDDLVKIIKETKMDLDKIEDETLRKEVEELKKRAEDAETRATEAAARIDELEKATEPEEEIVKEDLPESVQKALDEAENLRKSFEDTKAEIQKMKDEKLTTEIRDELKKYSAVIAEDDLDARVNLLKSLEADAREQLYKDYAKAAEVQKQSDSLFKELGETNVTSSDAYESLEKVAEEIRKSNPEMSKYEAFDKAVTDNPKMYNAYLAERKSQ